MLLDTHNVRFSYGSQHYALFDVTFQLEPNNLYALIGPNGSGKSTLIKVIMDLLKLQQGSVRINGEANSTKQAKMSSVYLASNDFLPEFLTGIEYLKFMHGLYSHPLDPELVDHYFTRYQMPGRQHDLIEDYSHGMRKKVQLISALMLKRPLTIIDETLNGIDIDAVYFFEEDVQTLRRDGRSTLLCSHDFRMLEENADHTLFLHRGLLVEDAPTAKIINQCGSLEGLVKEYLAVLKGTS